MRHPAKRKVLISRSATDDGAGGAHSAVVSRQSAETSQPSHFTARLNALLASADANQMIEMIARTNQALPDTDQRKIRVDDVRMLRRLAGQARTFSESLIDHANERRLVGERRGTVSPESGNTADWAERLATALEMVASPSAPIRRAGK